MIDWNEALIKELAARRCIIFLGAGASLGCKGKVADTDVTPPSWRDLLVALSGRMPAGSDRDFAQKLMDERKYLDAAEVIKSKITAADYADLMRSIFEAPKFEQSEIHEAVLRIDPKVVVTTNFDRIYDKYCQAGHAIDGYNVCKYYEDHLVSDLRSPIRLIVKAHGCISVPAKLVLTRREFFSARMSSPHFYSVLDALFLTHTILFIGYSLDDPDIQLTLENANISAPSNHTHYFVCEEGEHESLKGARSRTFNLTFHQFGKGDYDSLNKSLGELADRVLEERALHP